MTREAKSVPPEDEKASVGGAAEGVPPSYFLPLRLNGDILINVYIRITQTSTL